MQPRKDETRGLEKAPEVRREEPKPRRFRIVRLEERIAPLSVNETRSTAVDKSVWPCR